MRVLLVTHFFPPERNAGTENYTLALAQALRRRGHDARVVCAAGWNHGERYWNGVDDAPAFGVPVRRVRLHWARASDPNQVLYDSPEVERWFEAELGAFRPDVVHVTSAATLGVGVLRAARRRGVRLVFTLMDFWTVCPRTTLLRGDGALCDGRTTPWQCEACVLDRSRLYRRTRGWMPARLREAVWTGIAHHAGLRRLRGARGLALDMADRKARLADALAQPDVVLSHSRVVQRMVGALGLRADVRVLAPGHELAWLSGYAGRTASPVVRFGYVGQIAAIKGVHTLIEAFAASASAGRARLDVWGDPAADPPYARGLEAAARGVEGVAFRGAFTRADLPAVWAGIDVLVVPSRWYENAPLVIQEAFATGTPVVATNLGGMAEAVRHGVSGLLVERDSVADLARALDRLTSEPGLVAALARGVPPVKRIDEEADELEAIYRGDDGIWHPVPAPAA
ncbi:MAG: glycosyltransferase [Vicinamibacterales bacterium]